MATQEDRLSGCQLRAMRLLRIHGQLKRYNESSQWTPDGDWHSRIENNVVTNTVRALERKGHVVVNRGDASLEDVLAYRRLPDQRAVLTEGGRLWHAVREEQWLPAPSVDTAPGDLCGLCDSMAGCCHPRLRCAFCGEYGLRGEMERSHRCFDVVEVGIGRSSRLRFMGQGKTRDAAEGIVKLAVMRRGVEDQFFAVVVANTYATGDRWEGGAL